MTTKVKCDVPSFDVIGAGHIRISGGTSLIKPHYFEKELVSLEFTNGKVISKGEKIILKNKPYKINIIQKKTRKNLLFYDLKTCERTKSSMFIMPLLGGKRTLWFYDKALVNAFMGIENEFEDKIVLLYKIYQDPLFTKFLDIIQRFRSFYELRYLDNHHLLVIFNVPTKAQKNFDRFKNGKYSELSKLYKLKILEYHKMEVGGVVGQILFKSPNRKKKIEKMIGMEIPDDAEVYSIPNLKTELFNIKHYL